MKRIRKIQRTFRKITTAVPLAQHWQQRSGLFQLKLPPIPPPLPTGGAGRVKIRNIQDFFNKS